MTEALLTFPVDTPLRRQLQPPAARRHPGKLHLGFLAYLLTAHAPRGGRLLDPFAGSGSLLLATLPPWGCTVLCNELEPQWATQAAATWAYMQASPAQPAGTAAIRCGDARALAGEGFDGLITSPPYADMLTKSSVGPGLQRYAAETRPNSSRGFIPDAAYDALITSPPYADALSPQRHSDDYHPERQTGHNRGGAGAEALKAMRRGYDSEAKSRTQANPAQIGNLRGARYWAAMAEVWGACVPLVRPGGVVVVILKNIVRANREVDLIGGTRAQLEALGCRYRTTHYRAVAPGPFHRIRQKHNPAALVIDREAALVLEVPR